MLETIDAGGSRERDPRTLLTPRELQVLEMASYGLTNMQIAVRLSVTVHAIKFHLAAVYRKLDVKNRTEAVVVFLSAATLAAPDSN